MTNIVLRVSIINHNYRRLPHTGPPRNHSSDLTASPQCSIVSSHCQLAGAPVSSGRWLLSRVSCAACDCARIWSTSSQCTAHVAVDSGGGYSCCHSAHCRSAHLATTYM